MGSCQLFCRYSCLLVPLWLALAACAGGMRAPGAAPPSPAAGEGMAMAGHADHAACAQCEHPPHHLPALTADEVQRRYRFRVVTEPATPVAGEPVLCSVYILDPAGAAIETLSIHHERLAHFLFVHENLSDFHHLHPEDQGRLTAEARRAGRFDLQLTFAHGGRYLLALDFADGGSAVHWEHALQVAGPGAPATDWNLSRRRQQGDLELYLTTSSDPIEERRRQEASIQLRVGGRDVVDLEPYLGALTHLAIYSAEAKSVAHVHGGGEEFAHSHFHQPVPGYRGPKVYFAHTFAHTGRYRIYAQFQRQGRVYTVPFDVEVEPRPFDGA